MQIEDMRKDCVKEEWSDNIKWDLWSVYNVSNTKKTGNDVSYILHWKWMLQWPPVCSEGDWCNDQRHIIFCFFHVLLSSTQIRKDVEGILALHINIIQIVSELILVGYTFVQHKLNISWVEFWRSVPAVINWVLSALVILSRVHDDIVTIMVEKEECVNFICSLWWKQNLSRVL